MTSEDLNFVAEALLAICEADPERPCFSDEQLRVRERQRPDPDALWRRIAICRPHDPLLQRECAEIVALAALTPRQTAILQWKLDGATFEAISLRERCTRQSVRAGFIAALRKLRRAMDGYAFLGISDVYNQQTRRGNA